MAFLAAVGGDGMTAYLWVSLAIHAAPVFIALMLIGKKGAPGSPVANLIVYAPMLLWTVCLLWTA